MAKPTDRTKHIPHVIQTRGAVKEANERLRAARQERALSPNLLLPADVRGEYDASRVLMTTLGGEIRPLTTEDLQTFRDNIATVGRHYKKGLTAQKIINLSRDIDRERANREIHYAIPSSANRGTVRFITNASEQSEVLRHFTVVELMGYDAAVASPEEPSALASRLVKESPLRIWCDCGRYRYYYGFITTIGGCNAVVSENAFPKIRNPHLTGIACKHLLRTLSELQRSNSIRSIIAKMIAREQAAETARANSIVDKETAKKLARQQARKQRDVTVHIPKSVVRLREAGAKKWAKPKPSKDAEQARFDAERNLRKLKNLGQLSDADFKTILATLAKKG